MKNDFNQISTIRAVGLVQMIPMGLFLVVKWACFLILLIAGAFWLAYPYVSWRWIDRESLVGVVFVALALWAVCVLVLGFVYQKLMRCGLCFGKKTNSNENILEYLDFRVAQIFKKTLAHPHLPFEKLFLYYILVSGDMSFALDRLGVKKSDLKKKLLATMKKRSKSFSRDDEKKLEIANDISRLRILEKAREIAMSEGTEKITICALFLATADNDADFGKIMDEICLLKDDVCATVLWQLRRNDYQNFRKKFWERDNLRLGLGASPANLMIGGYTATLDRYARDLSLINPLRQGGVVLHAAEIEQMEAVLTKQKECGVLLVGEVGSGRKSIVYNFANQVFTEMVPHALDMMRIMELDMSRLAGDCPDKTILATMIDKIFLEAATAKNVILVISEINNYLGAHFNSEKLVQMDIGDILGKYLEVDGFRVIGITTHEGLRRSIDLVGDIAEKLAKIEVVSASIDDAMRVLKEEVLRRETKTGLFFPIATLKEIIRLCDNFLGDRAFPKKATDFLDDLIADRLGRKMAFKKTISVNDVAMFFSRKFSVPVGAAGLGEKDILLNLEDRIHEGLINQKEAVVEIANAMRRARAEIKKQKRTIGNFLFLGPTGVGKTETAKQLARVYFGAAKNMIHLNMAEYQTIESIEKLIGTERTPGYLTAAVRQNPFSLLLIDEIEKADIRVLDIFLSIFDEGQITDGMGRTIDFRHIIIIATSNAGAEAIRQVVERGRSLLDLKNVIIDDLLKIGVFKPEFINRFDAVVMYRPLDQGEMEQVASLLLGEVQNGLREKRIEFLITPRLRSELARIGFDPEFGGRAMRRALQDKVENPIATAILGGNLKSGDKFEIDCDSWQVEIIAQD